MHPVARGLYRAQLPRHLRLQAPYQGPKSVPRPCLVPAAPRHSPAFSTNTHRLEKKSAAPNPDEKDGNPEYPPFSLNALGLSRNVKILIYVLLGIFGTMETWFYCKAIWRWWKSRSEPVD